MLSSDEIRNDVGVQNNRNSKECRSSIPSAKKVDASETDNQIHKSQNLQEIHDFKNPSGRYPENCKEEISLEGRIRPIPNPAQ